MAELTEEGKTVLLEQWWGALNTSFEILLFGTAINPTNTSTYAEFAGDEILTGGYARIALVPGGWTFSGPNATYPTIQFTADTGPFGTVRGYACVTTEASPRSVSFEVGTDVPVLQGGRYGVNLSEVVP